MLVDVLDGHGRGVPEAVLVVDEVRDGAEELEEVSEPVLDKDGAAEGVLVLVVESEKVSELDGESEIEGVSEIIGVDDTFGEIEAEGRRFEVAIAVNVLEAVFVEEGDSWE